MTQMKWTLWQIEGMEKWAVCDGPGPLHVAGYVVRENGFWKAKGSDVQYLDMYSAAASITTEPLPPVGNFYSLARDGETRVVFTDPEALDIHRREGWRVVSILDLKTDPRSDFSSR
jgi:hypothetical protein